MQLLSRLPTKQYFISLFVIVSALFIAFSMVIYRHYSDAQHLNESTLYNYEIASQLRSVLKELLDMETGVRGFLLIGEESYLEPYEHSQKLLNDQIRNIREYAKNDPVVQKNMDVWVEKIDFFSMLLKRQIENRRVNGTAGISRQDLYTQKDKMDELRLLLEGFIKTRRDELKLQLDGAKTQQANFKSTLYISTIMAIGGMLITTMVIVSLINRSHKTEQKTREAEDRFLTVMNGVNDGLYDVNLTEGTIYFSAALKAMLGYKDNEFANTLEMFNAALHPDDAESAREILRQYKEAQIPHYNNVFRMRHKDGRWIWILSRGVGLKDSSGKMTRLIGTHTDITEQKKREELLEQLNKEMETLTYITSHDLRAPLVNLKGFARELQDAITKSTPIVCKMMRELSAEDQKTLKHAFEEDIPESLRFIVSSVEKMDKLTTAVLDLSRIGKKEYQIEKVDTQAIVKRCLDTLGYEINQKKIEVIYEKLPVVISDSLALEQIFSNIIDNAVKYLDSSRLGKIVIAAQEIGSEVIFSIQDNGRGIDNADKQKVFQFFRRARNTIDVRGQGMGMTFVQATLRRLGGEIWFDSAPGKGTTFYFRLPKHSLTQGEAA